MPLFAFMAPRTSNLRTRNGARSSEKLPRDTEARAAVAGDIFDQRVPRNPIFELEISTEPGSSVTSPPIILPLDPGAGRHDPFVRYPVPMSIRMHEIVDQSESITDTVMPHTTHAQRNMHTMLLSILCCLAD